MSDDLPNLDELDLEATRALLRAAQTQIAAQGEEIRTHLEELTVLRGRVEWLKRQVFGRKSEKTRPQDMGQLLLEFAALQQETAGDPGEVVQDDPSDEPPEWEEIQYKRKKPRGHGRRELPEGLPRIRSEYPLPLEERGCEGCEEVMGKIGEVVSEELEFVPAALFVHQHVRFRYGCAASGCRERPPVTAPPAPKVIEKGRAGPGLLAQVLVGKFDDHLPLNRQEKIFRRHGASIARSTMSDWVGQCAEVLAPLHDHLRQGVLASRVVATDDTEVPVLEPGRGETRRGRLWTYLGDERHPYVVFDYTPNRSRDGPLAFLAGYRGFLQADAYAGYRVLYRQGEVIEVACWAHVRRKFHEAQSADRARATQAMGYIRALYAIERRAKDLSADERQALRQEHARPILAQLEKWLEEAQAEVLPRGPMGGAVSYARNLWPSLLRYLEDGELAIDNNASEREMKAVVIGRKNWMFAGSDEGGHRAAVIYSLIRSARRCGVEPYRYLADVLRRIRSTSAEDLSQLAPDRWASEQAEIDAAVEAATR